MIVINQYGHLPPQEVARFEIYHLSQEPKTFTWVALVVAPTGFLALDSYLVTTGKPDDGLYEVCETYS